MLTMRGAGGKTHPVVIYRLTEPIKVRATVGSRKKSDMTEMIH